MSGKRKPDEDATPAEEAAPDSAPDGEEPGLEARLRRLDRIVAMLEADDLELDRALELFEEGVRHVRHAERILAETELRVEELLGDGSEGRTGPFEGDR